MKELLKLLSSNNSKNLYSVLGFIANLSLSEDILEGLYKEIMKENTIKLIIDLIRSSNQEISTVAILAIANYDVKRFIILYILYYK